jgi:Uma2 family endonuclease
MSPQSPHHASGVWRAQRALAAAVGDRAVVRAQSPLLAGHHSVPEPDVAVVPGGGADYERVHPTTALLVVEVADSSLLQDRLTKAAIYAAAGIPELWIVNLRDGWVEVAHTPAPATRRYTTAFVARRGERLGILALEDSSVLVDDLLPALER